MTRNGPEYFLSDAHFGAHDSLAEQGKIDRFVSFLAAPEHQGSTVWFLGDLFDFWFEYRRAIPRVSVRVLAAIQSFVDGGGRFHWLVGNHDCWGNDFLSDELGVVIHQEDVIVDREEGKMFLSHGDGKAVSDRGSRNLRRILRFKPGIWLFRHLPVDLGFALAVRFSRSSRQWNASRGREFVGEYRDYARRKIAEGFQAVIMGHLHEPACERLETGWYVNCGEWFERFSYVKRTTGGEFELHQWTGNVS